MRTAMDRDEMYNWAGDPLGTSLQWIADSTVALFRGSAMVEVPDVVGSYPVQARQRLARAGLKAHVFGEIEPGYSIVVSQNPPPGRTVQRRSTVDLSFAGQDFSYAAGPG
jgi:beta-lactam-binding protein with PASTA domain